MNSRRAAQIFTIVAGSLGWSQEALAACDHWSLSGHWEFWQSNKAKTTFELHQDSTGKLTGGAHYEIEGPDSIFTSFGEMGSGSVTGQITGNSFRLVVGWRGDVRGEYLGNIGPEGQLTGSTSDLSRPHITATWHEWAGRRAKCLPFQVNRPDLQVINPTPFSPPPREGTDFGGGPAPPVQTTATAIRDVDIWSGAGQPGEPYKCGATNCFLSPSDGPQPVLGYDTDGWYHIRTDKVPPGSGWVAADHLIVQ